MATDGTHFTFTAGRTPADTFAVVNFKLKQSLSSLFSLEITVACNDPAIGFKAILDEYALLTIWQAQYQEEGADLSYQHPDCASLVMHLAQTAWRHMNTKENTTVLVLSSSDDRQRCALVLSPVNQGRN